MIDVTTLRAVFNDKLAATDSLDAAFTKAVWVAYKAGLSAACTPDSDRAVTGDRQIINYGEDD